MRPLGLELANFLAFADAKVDFRDLHGLVLLSGEHRGTDAAADSNGAGKSALIDGLCWALYGKMARPKHRAEDVVRRQVGGNCRVGLVFLDRDGREIEIVRHRKHDRHKDALLLSNDGVDARGSSTAETQKRIDQIVGMDFDTFAGSVLFTQHPLRGRFAELSDEQKKDLLDSILGVEVLGRARELVKGELRAKESELAKTEGRAQALRNQLAWIERQRAECVVRSQAWEREHEARLGALTRRGETLRAEREALRAREPVVPVARAPSGALDELAIATQALERAEAGARRADAELEKRSSRFQAQGATARALLTRLQGELAKLKTLGDACPVCKQPISAATHVAHADAIGEEMSEHARTILAAREELAGVEAARARARAVWLADRQERERQIAEIRKRAEAGRAAEAQHAAWRREADALARQLAHADEALAAASKEENAFSALVAKAEVEQQDQQEGLAACEEDLGRLRTEIERLRFWDHGFGPRGLKSYLFDSILPLLNARAAFYADLLTQGTLRVQFSTTIEKGDALEDRFSVSITTRSGVDSYGLLSGGERQRCNLIINFALQDLVASRACRPVPIAIYDEAFEGLDRAGVEAAVRVLSEAAREKELVLVVTHQEHLKDLFAHELRVISERGQSVVEPIS